MGKKAKDVVKIDKENRELIESELIDEIVSNIIKVKGPKNQKKTRFFLYWFLGLSAPVAGDLSGYKQSTAYGMVHKYRNVIKYRDHIDKEILAGMPDRYKALCKMRLPDIAIIEQLGLDQYKDNPEMILKHPQLLKQLKSSAGVTPDETPTYPTVNIQEVQNLMLEVTEQRDREIAAEKQGTAKGEIIINDTKTTTV